MIILVQTIVLSVFCIMGVLILPPLGSATFHGLILPVFTLGILPAAYVARLVTISLDEIEREDYLRTAMAKGLTRIEAMIRHGLRNVCVTVLNSMPSLFGMIISSLVIVEYLYVYPGLGNLMLHSFSRPAIYGLDSTVLAGAGMMLATVYFVLDAIAAVAKTIVDPRLRG